MKSYCKGCFFPLPPLSDLPNLVGNESLPLVTAAGWIERLQGPLAASVGCGWLYRLSPELIEKAIQIDGFRTLLIVQVAVECSKLGL